MASPQMNAVVWETNFPGIQLSQSRQGPRSLRGGRATCCSWPRTGFRRSTWCCPRRFPDKGRVLTQLSLFWFDLLRDVIPNHVVTATEFPAGARAVSRAARGRSMLCRKTKPLPSNAWCADICGLGLEGLSRHRQSLRHRAAAGPARIRPAAGADFHAIDQGHHRATTKIFRSTSGVARSAANSPSSVRAVSLEIYRRAAAYAEPRGIILADTKFEFGLDRRRTDLD